MTISILTHKPVQLLDIVIMVSNLYPSTYCLIQGSSFICSNFKISTFYLKIRITTFNRTTSYQYKQLGTKHERS